MATIKNNVLSVLRNAKTGLTVAEIDEKVYSKLSKANLSVIPDYSTVRARVYELAAEGRLERYGTRPGNKAGTLSTVFRVPVPSPF